MNGNAKTLTMDAIFRKLPMRKEAGELLVVVTVSNADDTAVKALDYAKALSQDVLALHVSISPTEKDSFAARWKYLTNVPLRIIDTPEEFIESSHTDSITNPIKLYVEELLDSKPYRLVAVVIPEYTSRRWWNRLTHSQTAQSIKNSLRHLKGVVTVSFPVKGVVAMSFPFSSERG